MLAGAASSMLATSVDARPVAPTTPGVDPGSHRSNDRASQSAEATLSGKSGEALRLAEKAIKADPKNPWAYYNKADALADLRRVDAAVEAFQEAQRRFSTFDVYGKSIAIYGRAHALDQAGRCDEAARAYHEYAAFIRTDDPASADMAERFSDDCVRKAQGQQRPEPAR